MSRTLKKKQSKSNLEQLREKFMQRKYGNTTGKPLGIRLNNYVGHTKHDKKIEKLVKEYIGRPMTVRRRWKVNKYVMTPSNSAVLVNTNEIKKSKGQLYKRRPMSQKKSNAIRNSMMNSPNHYDLFRPGSVYNKNKIYQNPDFPNPYVK